MNALRVVLVALAVGMAPPLVAQASEDKVLPKPDMEGWWRVIHVDDTRSTGNCIGKTDTPLCVVATWLGCEVRRDKSLCEMVDPLGVEDRSAWAPSSRPTALRYRIVSADRLGRKNIPKPSAENDTTKWRSGDIRIVFLPVRCTVYAEGEYCQTSRWLPEGLIIRRDGDRWIVAAKIAPSGK